MEIESRGENKVFLFETFCEIPFILSNGFDFGLKLMLRCLYGIIRSLAMHILLCDEKITQWFQHWPSRWVRMIQLTGERAAFNFVLWFDKNILVVILSYSWILINLGQRPKLWDYALPKEKKAVFICIRYHTVAIILWPIFSKFLTFCLLI